MKVLFCTNAFSQVSNGPAKFANILAKSNKPEYGHEIRILTEDCENDYENVYKIDIRYPTLLKPFSQFFRMYQYHRKAMHIRKSYQFDTLVYNNALVGFLSLLFFSGTFGMVNDYTNATWKKKTPGNTDERSFKRWVFYVVEKWFCRLSRNPVITNSEFLTEILASEYRVRKSKFRILRKGIEQYLLEQDRNKILSFKIPDSILFVKTNYMLAGFADLASALKLLDKKLLLTVVGPADMHHNSIRKMFENTNVILDLRSHQSQETIFELMKTHKVFCLPSYKEAFGVSILEALCCACKVVASRVGGIPEALGYGKWAYFVKPGNPEELASELNAALCSSDISVDPGLEIHLSNFSAVKLVDRFFEIVEKK